MLELPQIIEDIRTNFTAKNAVRDITLNRSRELIRYCALSIRAIHRHEWEEAEALLATARQAADVMTADLAQYHDLYEAGYTQDALKELVEAHTLYAMVRGDTLSRPADLHVPAAAYLNGLAEAASELRRFILDLIRLGRTREGEPYLAAMDDAYIHLVTMDFPDALTAPLVGPQMLRGVLERTRGDLTVAVRQEEPRSRHAGVRAAQSCLKVRVYLRSRCHMISNNRFSRISRTSRYPDIDRDHSRRNCRHCLGGMGCCLAAMEWHVQFACR
jgi:translin